MNINDFGGAKLAVLARGHVLALLRDNNPEIAFPNQWDLPGGGREGKEAPLDCALRETFEEARLRIAASDICWRRLYRSDAGDALPNWFFVAAPGWLSLPPVILGDEGQALRWMKLETFLSHPEGIAHLQARLRDYLAEHPQAA